MSLWATALLRGLGRLAFAVALLLVLDALLGVDPSHFPFPQR